MEKGLWKTLTIIFIIISIVLASMISLQNFDDCDDGIAMVDAQKILWAENFYDSSEMFFDYNVYNYGNSEVKNLKVTCEVWDETGMYKLHSSTDTYGNLASKSYDVKEYTVENVIIEEGIEYYSFCYVESCDNCRILHESIPELVETYGIIE